MQQSYNNLLTVIGQNSKPEIQGEIMLFYTQTIWLYNTIDISLFTSEFPLISFIQISLTAQKMLYLNFLHDLVSEFELWDCQLRSPCLKIALGKTKHMIYTDRYMYLMSEKKK